MKVDAKAAVGNVAKAIKELDRVRLEMSSLEKRDKKSKKKVCEMDLIHLRWLLESNESKGTKGRRKATR